MDTKCATYTVKQLAELAGVSIRTLHYYDEIGLLRPESIGGNGYCYYGRASLLRLQQILFFRELDFSLAEIQALLDRSGFSLIKALSAHKQTLRRRITRLERLMITIEKTLQNVQGEMEMSDQEYYEGFDEEKQKEYEQYVSENWGDEDLKVSQKRWASYSPDEKKEILRRGKQIEQDIASNMAKSPTAPEVQAYIHQLYEHMGVFYDCSLQRFEGLGHLYNQHPEFIAHYEEIAPGMAPFMEQAVVYYCQQRRK